MGGSWGTRPGCLLAVESWAVLSQRGYLSGEHWYFLAFNRIPPLCWSRLSFKDAPELNLIALRFKLGMRSPRSCTKMVPKRSTDSPLHAYSTGPASNHFMPVYERQLCLDFLFFITGLSWSFYRLTLWHQCDLYQGTGRFLFNLYWNCGIDQLLPHAEILIQLCHDHLSCWLSSNVMALRQSPELQVILGAGCRVAGHIKESDTSRKMNSELLMAMHSWGLRGSRSACSAACPNRGRCVCERQSDREWWLSVQHHLNKPWHAARVSFPAYCLRL